MTVNVKGDFFGVVTCDGEIKIQFNDGVFITREQGMGGSADYERVTLLSDSTKNIVIALGYGTMYDSRGFGNGAGDGMGVSIISPSASPSNPDIELATYGTVAVLAENANRSEVTIYAHADNFNTLKVGCNNSVGSGQGVPLPPGGAITLTARTGVWVFCPHTATETIDKNHISIIEMEH